MIAFAQGADCVERQANGPPCLLFPTCKPNQPVHFSKKNTPPCNLSRSDRRELKVLRILFDRAKIVLAAEALHDGGVSWPQIGPKLGTHWNTIFGWHQAYQAHGLDGLKPKFSPGCPPRTSSQRARPQEAAGSSATPPPLSGRLQLVPRPPRQIASVARPVAEDVAKANRVPIEAKAWHPRPCRRAA